MLLKRYNSYHFLPTIEHCSTTQLVRSSTTNSRGRNHRLARLWLLIHYTIGISEHVTQHHNCLRLSLDSILCIG